MNSTLTKSQAFTWRDIPVRDLRSLRARLIKKYETLSQASVALKLPFIRLSMALNGRENIIWIISVIQKDQELSNHEVLMLWPLLREWPKTDRRAA